jgi:hypothetical protein
MKGNGKIGKYMDYRISDKTIDFHVEEYHGGFKNKRFFKEDGIFYYDLDGRGNFLLISPSKNNNNIIEFLRKKNKNGEYSICIECHKIRDGKIDKTTVKVNYTCGNEYYIKVLGDATKYFKQLKKELEMIN